MIRFGSRPSPHHLFRGSLFLVDELSIRLAQRIVQLETLPYDLPKIPSIIKVKEMYFESFCRLMLFPKITLSSFLIDKYPPSDRQYSRSNIKRLYSDRFDSEDRKHLPSLEIINDYNNKLIREITDIKNKHANVASSIAQGVFEWKKKIASNDLEKEIQSFLNDFYQSRIGIRVLIGHHCALPTSKHVGIIDLHCNPLDIAHDAIANATFIFEQHYSVKAPQVLVYGNQVQLTSLSSHIHHILFELLKNSMRAHYETKQVSPIRIIIADGKEDVTIKVSDEGGGIPRSGLPLIWTFMYTTAGEPDLIESDFRAPLAGYGYGLPLSRLVN